MKSIRWTLLAFLLPALAVLMCGELWLSYRELRSAANAAYDRSLAGAIKGIDAGVSTASGGLAVELPYQMLEFFQLTANGKVFYRISTEDGLVTLGNADLPAPKILLTPGVPHFYDAEYFLEPVRIGAYLRRLDKPLYGQDTQNVVIQVAESTQSRSTFVAGLLHQGVVLDVLLVFAIAALMTAAVVLALRPVLRVRAEVLERAQDDLAPMDPTGVPREIRPLVEAINHHLGQWVKLARTQALRIGRPDQVVRGLDQVAVARFAFQQQLDDAALFLQGTARSRQLIFHPPGFRLLAQVVIFADSSRACRKKGRRPTTRSRRRSPPFRSATFPGGCAGTRRARDW